MDLESRVHTYFLSWIKRILSNPESSSAKMLGNMLGNENRRVTLGAKGPLPRLQPPISPFYAKVIETWVEVHDFPPTDESSIRGEIIWDNRIISSPKNMLPSVNWKKWIEAGILMVNHICHESESRTLGQQEIKDKFGINWNFLEALRIRSSIPHKWRAKLTENFTQKFEEMVRRVAPPFNRDKSCVRDLNLEEQGVSMDWNNIFRIPFQITRETKLQSFSYKLVYRLTPCNKYLCTIRIKDSLVCSLCPETDSLSHFFLRCAKVKPFWDSLSEWWEKYLDLSLLNLMQRTRTSSRGSELRTESEGDKLATYHGQILNTKKEIIS